MNESADSMVAFIKDERSRFEKMPPGSTMADILRRYGVSPKPENYPERVFPDPAEMVYEGFTHEEDGGDEKMMEEDRDEQMQDEDGDEEMEKQAVEPIEHGQEQEMELPS